MAAAAHPSIDYIAVRIETKIMPFGLTGRCFAASKL
jgi:hypothetical protein